MRVKRGFTLIEIAVTALLIGVALVPIFNMLSHGTRHTGTTRKLVMATYLAVESLEIIKQMDFDEVVGSKNEQIPVPDVGSEKENKIIYAYIKKKDKVYAYDTTEGGKVSYGAEYKGFFREISIIDNPKNPDVKRVQVTVGWDSKNPKDMKKNKIVLYAVLIRDDI